MNTNNKNCPMNNELEKKASFDEDRWENFLYNVSHNIRGPIATIKGLVIVAELEKYEIDHKFFYDTIYKKADLLDEYLKSLYNMKC